MNIIYVNTESENAKIFLKTKIEDSQLSDKKINDILIKNTIPKKQFQEKIYKNLDDPTLNTAEIAEKISKQCQKEKTDNIRKIDNIKRKTIQDQIIDPKLYEFFQNEKQIVLILDNYSPHKSKLVQLLCKILNIRLIFLPPYSPHLNPIEHV